MSELLCASGQPASQASDIALREQYTAAPAVSEAARRFAQVTGLIGDGYRGHALAPDRRTGCGW
jgi:hypothetical protein